jgi:hypothetical protein
MIGASISAVRVSNLSMVTAAKSGHFLPLSGQRESTPEPSHNGIDCYAWLIEMLFQLAHGLRMSELAIALIFYRQMA